MLACLLLASPVSAQVIHGHAEKAVYASPAEWVFDSGQCHWKRSNGDDSIFIPATALTIEVPHSLGHVHTELTFPRDAEVSGPFQANFTIKAFHLAGRITGFYKDRVRDMVFDGFAPGEMPDLVGDPHGLKVWTGHLTVDIGQDQYPYPTILHGWTTIDLVTVVDLDNGGHVEGRLIEPLWSMLDPSAPVPAYNPHVFAVRCEVQTPERESNHFGTTIVELPDDLPLATLAPVDVWTFQANTSGYGAANDPTLPEVIMQQRVDLDLHAGLPGRVLFNHKGRQNQSGLLTLDAAVWGAGKHRMAVIRDQVDGENEVAALLVAEFVVAAVVPPPPPPPVDVCLNIEGVQTAVPTGLVLSGGVCALPAPPPPVVSMFSLTITCDAVTGCKVVVK